MEQKDRDTLIRLEERMRTLDESIVELTGLISGPPYDRSVRARLHKLENDAAAANAATAAIAATKMMRDQIAEKRFTRTEKMIGLAFAFILSASSLVSSVLLITSHTG